MSSFSCTDLAYLAAIIDGEGTLTIKKVRPSGGSKSSTYRAVIEVGNTSQDLIDWLRARFGGNAHSRSFRGRWRKMWYWSLNHDNMEAVLEAIRPYLVIKRDQAGVLLSFLSGGEFGPKSRPGLRGFGRTSDAELARREGHYQQTRRLNLRGTASAKHALAH